VTESDETPGTRAMDAYEQSRDAQLARLDSTLTEALVELRSLDVPSVRFARLTSWALHYPAATVALLYKIGRDPEAAAELAPSVLALMDRLRTYQLDAVDAVLIAAFPTLTGAYREVAAERDAVRRAFHLVEGVDFTEVPAIDAAWTAPSGDPVPPASEIAGAKARLNHLGYAAGPLTNEWSPTSRRALARWQVHEHVEPTGELDADTIEMLDWATPDL